MNSIEGTPEANNSWMQEIENDGKTTDNETNLTSSYGRKFSDTSSEANRSSIDDKCQGEFIKLNQSGDSAYAQGNQNPIPLPEENIEKKFTDKHLKSSQDINQRVAKSREDLFNKPITSLSTKKPMIKTPAECFAIRKELTNAKGLDALLDVCSRYIDKFSYIDITTALRLISKKLVTSYSTERSTDMIQQLANKTVEKINDFKTEELCHTISVFENLGIRNESLFAAFAKATKQKIRSFRAEDLPRLVYSFARLGLKDEELFNLLAIQVVRKTSLSAARNTFLDIKIVFSSLEIKNEYFEKAYALHCQKGQLKSPSLEK